MFAFGPAIPNNHGIVKIIMSNAVDERGSFFDQVSADSFLNGGAEIAENADKAHGSTSRFFGGDIHGKESTQGSDQAIN